MRNAFIILTTAALLVSCAGGKQARIGGTLSGLSNDTLLLEEVTTKERRIIDSAFTNERGDFRFKVTLPSSNPTFYNIICNSCTIPLLVNPGERIEVNSLGDLARNYTVEGSPDSRLLKEFVSAYQSGVTTMDSLSKLYALTRPGVQSDDRRKELLKAYTQAYLNFKRQHIAFIVKNANSLASIYALYQRLPNDEPLFNASTDFVYYQLVADSLAQRYPNSGHVTALQRDIETQQQQLALVNRINALAAEQDFPLPEIVLKDLYDKEQKLSASAGKVILIDFWTISDARSSVLNAEYKELYQEYAPDGFEIYQVSIDNNKANWISAVLQQRLPWISVLEPSGMSGAAPLNYQIEGVPSNILIDKQGKIIGRNYYGAALKTKLNALTK